MGKPNSLILLAVFVASFIVSQLYDHFASRNADAVKAVKVKATALLINFYAMGFALLWMMPSSFAFDPFVFGREATTVEQLVPLLKQQAQVMADFRDTVYLFIFLSVIAFGPALRALFGKAVDAAAGRDGSGPR